MVDDQAKAITALHASYPRRNPGGGLIAYNSADLHEAIDRAVEISRASEGSRVDDEALAAWARAICPECAGPLGNVHDGVCEICFGKRCGIKSRVGTYDVERVTALVVAAEKAVEVLRLVATKGNGVGPLYSHANAASWNLSAAISALSPPATPQAPEDVRAQIYTELAAVRDGIITASEAAEERDAWAEAIEGLAAVCPPTILCSDCPPADYPTDKTRCLPCPRRKG